MNHSIPERKDTDPRFRWHIEDYFKTDTNGKKPALPSKRAFPK